MSYVMYPDVFIKFARAQESYGELDVLPTDLDDTVYQGLVTDGTEQHPVRERLVYADAFAL